MLQEDRIIKKEKGQVAIIAVIVVSLLLVTVVFAISKMSLTNYEMSDISIGANQAYFLAESGLEEAIYQLKQDLNYTGGDYSSPIGRYVITIVRDGYNFDVRSEGYSDDIMRAVEASFEINIQSERITSYGGYSGDDVWMYWWDSEVNGDVWADDDFNLSSDATINGNLVSAGRGSFFTSWITADSVVQDNPNTLDVVEGNVWSVNRIKITSDAVVYGNAYSESSIWELLGGNVVGDKYEYQDLTSETERIEVPQFDFNFYKSLSQSSGTYFATATQFENYVNGLDDGSYKILPDGVYYIENGNVFFDTGNPIVLNGSIVTDGEITFYCGLEINALNNIPAIAAAKAIEIRDYGWPFYGGDFVTINGVLYSERDIVLRHDSSGKEILVNGAAWAGDDLYIESAAVVNYDADVANNVEGFGFATSVSDINLLNWEETL